MSVAGIVVASGAATADITEKAGVDRNRGTLPPNTRRTAIALFLDSVR